MPIVERMVEEHAVALASAVVTRRALAGAPHPTLVQIERIDERIAAHLDGLALAGDAGRRVLAGVVDAARHEWGFTAMSLLASGDVDETRAREAAAGCVTPEARTGGVDGAGWALKVGGLSDSLVRGVARVDAPMALSMAVRVRPELVDEALVESRSVSLDALLASELLRAALAAGGRERALRVVETFEASDDRAIAVDACRARVLATGLRHDASALAELSGLQWTGPAGPLAVAMQAIEVEEGHRLLGRMFDREQGSPAVIRAIGAFGDPRYIPWLLARTRDPAIARVVGESFAFIVGVDLAGLDLERRPPDDFESGPTDDPDDPGVETDPDDGLPWPDPDKVDAWWRANSHRFPAGRRFFMGRPPAVDHCVKVLAEGRQRQRIAAAHWRCLLAPGTPLFPTDAPAWRQRRRLAQEAR
ncbi:MAG: hypothetical protein U1E86_19110 [Burkholderiaceae bacterium]